MNVLVIALDASSPLDLQDADVLVVAPALNSRLRRWLSDEDEARRRAEARAFACVEQLERNGAHATSATPISCRRSPTRCRASRPTRS